MEHNIFKALNRGVKSAGYERYQISAKTLKEIREMLITNPKQLEEFLDLAINLRSNKENDKQSA